jgi:hypothetical protein
VRRARLPWSASVFAGVEMYSIALLGSTLAAVETVVRAVKGVFHV